jgi:hypothetical protein
MDNLFWIREKAAPPQDEEDAVYRQVVSQAPDIQVAIYQGAEIDPDLTAASGRPRYRNAPMLCKRNVGEKDFVSEPLTDEHRRRFPRAWAGWQAQADKRAKLSIQLLPNIMPADVAELDALGIHDVDTLASTDVPAELQPWRSMANRLRTLSKPRLRLVDGQLQEVA